MQEEAQGSRTRVATSTMRWRGAVLGVFFLLGCLIRFHNLTEVLVEGRFYFVDADCYSRMSRVREVAEHPGTVVRMHWFENWPEGVVSHATSPLDYAIYLLSLPVRWLTPETGRWSVLAGQSLDVAGALVGPLFGMISLAAVAAAVGLFAKTRLEPGAFVSVGLAAVSPALVHATVFGRPDHQAPLVALLALALCAEMRLAAGTAPGWAWVGGLALGMALWVSWFEPVVFLVLLTACGFWGWPHTWSLACRKRWLLGLLGCVALGVVVDGFRVAFPRVEFWEHLQRWGSAIGELQQTDLPFGLFRWTGLLLLGVPVCVVQVVRKMREAGARARAELGWFAMVAVLIALTVWQIRWSPYLALVFALVIPALVRRVPNARLRAVLVAVSFWPVAAEWDARWFPSPEASVDRHLDRSERITLRQAAERLRSEELQPFVAPWWHAPALAYWSAQPSVAGSSHQSIAGIRDSARIYLGTNPSEVRVLLCERRVRVVVAGDRARIVENSAQILGGVPEGKPLADVLWSADIPPHWGLHGESNVTTFRLVRVLP